MIFKYPLGWGPTNLWFRKCGFNYLTYNFYPSAGGIFHIVGATGSRNGYARSNAEGIRPVLTIKGNILFHNTSEGNNHNTQETAWNLIL